MDKLYSWTVARSGSGMSVTHSCGKITNITSITVGQTEVGPFVLAIGSDGRRYELALASSREG